MQQLLPQGCGIESEVALHIRALLENNTVLKHVDLTKVFSRSGDTPVLCINDSKLFSRISYSPMTLEDLEQYKWFSCSDSGGMNLNVMMNHVQIMRRRRKSSMGVMHDGSVVSMTVYSLAMHCL